MADIAGLTTEAFLERAEALNIFDAYQGPAKSHGDAFDVVRAAKIAESLPIDGRRVVFLGHAVAHAFGHRRVDFFTALKDPRAQVAWCMPHPSRGSRWWNKSNNCTTARLFLRAVLGVDGVSE
jgi:hypothetical protein